MGQLVFPALGIRRDDLIACYRDIGAWMLPHLRRRPLTLVRCRRPITRPDALRSECAFVRHAERDSAWAPSAVPRVPVQEQKKVGHYLYVESVDHITSLVERGVIEFHVWNACVDRLERPDRIVFDLDPGPPAPWALVVAAAKRIRDMLERLGLESWPRTTGGRGLHVVVPLLAVHDWDFVFAFSRAIAALLARDDPNRFTVSFTRADRGARVLIDYKRNHRTAIAIAGFSARARPDATMAVPLGWREVSTRLQPDRYTVANIRDRLQRLRADPWAGYWHARQQLPDLGSPSEAPDA